MRYSVGVTLIVAALGISVAAALARPSSLDQWFSRATAVDTPGTVRHIATPDFMCGKTFKTMCKSHLDGSAQMLTFWGLLKYDREHHVGLARSSTDQVGFALFKAPPPPGVSVSDADLSQYGTGRGLRIGSTYAQVLALYGPPVKHGQHFVTSYGANDTTYFQGKPEEQPEVITLVIDDGHVSSITINIELWEP
jgi:hypothetical protein